MKKKATKRYQEMTTAELREATKEFDRPFVFLRTRPMNAAERAQERKARRKIGRPKIGHGCERINISLERGLLKQRDRWAEKRGIGRSELIAQVLASAMGRKAG